MNSDDINDIDLDAFLKGEDELSRHLQALPQAEPSAALDAAVLARARAAMAPAAANDPAPLPMRWRVPAGLAAMLLVGVLAHRSYDAGGEMAPAPEAAPAAAPAPQVQAAPQEAMPPPPAAAPKAEARRVPPAKPVAREKYAVQKPAGLPHMVDEALEHIPGPTLSRVPAPMPQPAPPAQDLPDPGQSVLVTGQRASLQSSMRVQQAASSAAPLSLAPSIAAAPAAPAAEMAARDIDAERWLALIDEMLKAGLRSDALIEWARFRAAHPNYRVSAELTERINAARN